MIKKFLSFAFLGILLVACKENNTEAVQNEETAPTTETVQPEATNAQTNATPTEGGEAVQVQQPAANQPQPAGPFTQQPQQTQQASPTVGQTAPGFSGKPNPAHGQPGHRCDIKVGDILP